MKLTFISFLAATLLLSCCCQVNAQQGNTISHKELQQIAYCLQETSNEVAIPGNYWSKNGTAALRYLKGEKRGLNLVRKDIVVAAYSPNGRDARIYIVWITDDEGRPEFTLRQMADLWKEKGRWRSEYPMQGGLGSLEELEQIHAMVIKRPVVTISRAGVKKQKSGPGSN